VHAAARICARSGDAAAGDTAMTIAARAEIALQYRRSFGGVQNDEQTRDRRDVGAPGRVTRRTDNKKDGTRPPRILHDFSSACRPQRSAATRHASADPPQMMTADRGGHLVATAAP
jgi:hypothetical protein